MNVYDFLMNIAGTDFTQPVDSMINTDAEYLAEEMITRDTLKTFAYDLHSTECRNVLKKYVEEHNKVHFVGQYESTATRKYFGEYWNAIDVIFDILDAEIKRIEAEPKENATD